MRPPPTLIFSEPYILRKHNSLTRRVMAWSRIVVKLGMDNQASSNQASSDLAESRPPVSLQQHAAQCPLVSDAFIEYLTLQNKIATLLRLNPNLGSFVQELKTQHPQLAAQLPF